MAKPRGRITIMVIVICMVVACIAVVPTIIVNNDSNPWNDTWTFDDWVEIYTGPDPTMDALTIQLPDQQDTIFWESGRIPSYPRGFSFIDMRHYIALPYETIDGSGYVQLFKMNASALILAIGLEQDRDLYCNNGTAHVFWFNSLVKGYFFYIVYHDGSWYMNHIAAYYTLADLLAWLGNAGIIVK